jgi:CubicO group peptidase (beta-lactamase class C family)
VTGYFFHPVIVRRCLLILLLIVAVASSAVASEFVTQHPKVADALTLLDIWIEEQRLYHQIPGIAVGIVYDQELIWSQGYGFSDLESRTPMTPETLVRIGSVTKVFTATAVMQLRDQGKLDLQDLVTRHLPNFKIQNPFPDAPEITIWNLLTHTAGLPREAAFPYWTDHEFPSREEVVAAAADQTLIYSPGTEYKYSNLGTSLLGAIIEEASGESYRDFIEDRIFSPLGMTRSAVDPPFEEIGELATAYMRRQPDGSREPMDYYEVRGMASMGSIVSSIEDMARFASLHLRQGNSTADGEILRTGTMREMHRPQWVYSSWSRAWCPISRLRSSHWSTPSTSVPIHLVMKLST